jgi:FkbM family methyltransferase
MNYYAEYYTDKFIRENYFPNFDEKLLMVEVGAGPPEFYSMSKHFRENNWRCICIDPNPKFVNMHKELGNEIYQYACSDIEGTQTFNIVETSWDTDKNGISYSSLGLKYPLNEKHNIFQIEVETITLDTLLTKLNIKEVNLLSVDTEGWEIEVLKGFDFNTFNPKVVVIENYLHNKNYETFMNSKGYSLKNKLEYNYIFTK